jgi:hypothetical protein
MFNRKYKKIEACFIALLSFVFLTTMAFGQGTGSSLTGTIQDPSGGVVPNAAVVARNVDTGVETRATSTNAGSYTFPSLPVGTYELSVEAPGFSRAVRSIRLNVGGQARLDIPLAVAGTVTEVSVTGAIESVMLEAGASTGTVMQEELLTSIPLLSGNVMELINIMGGVTAATDPVFGAASQTFAGVASGQINVTRDGMSVTEVRNPVGIAANTNINTEMIGEFRMVLSPVDAEMGRGAGQVQMTTRSGSNAFHGSGVWNIQNTAIDARDFSDKLSNNPANWRNLNNYMLTGSGPIIRNRSFFFVTWEQQIAREKIARNVKVLTPCARSGIYRYLAYENSASASGYSAVVPGAINRNSTYSTSGANINVVPSVDESGKPLAYTTHGTQTFYHNQNFSERQFNFRLNAESIFGNLTNAARAQLLADTGPTGLYGDCSSLAFNTNSYTSGGNNTSNYYGLTVGGSNILNPNSYWRHQTTSWAHRNAYDPTGYVNRMITGVDYSAGTVGMPGWDDFSKLNYDIGDGLNYAGYRFHDRMVGFGGSIYGTGGDPDRKSITFKVDHNVNNEHRLSGTYTYEKYYVMDAYRQWPTEYGGYSGGIERKPQTMLVSLTSTLRPTILNEARFGLSLSDTWTYAPDEGPTGAEMKSAMEALMPLDLTNSTTSGVPALIGVGTGAMVYSTDPSYDSSGGSHPYGSRGNVPATWGGSDPRWTIADTVTWMKGAHSFKGGFEYRRQSSTQDYMGVRDFGGNGGHTNRITTYGGLTSDASDARSGLLSSNRAGERWRDLTGLSSDSFGFAGGNYTIPYQMMTLFSGSLGAVRQYFYGMPNEDGTARWNNPANGEDYYSYTIANQEISFFFKDDWKLNNSLTLNLGVRYEYYGVPYASDGRTLGLRGGSASMIGVTNIGGENGAWTNWMGNREAFHATGMAIHSPNYGPGACTMNMVTFATSCPIDVSNAYISPIDGMYQYVGSGSRNSDLMAWNRDTNNFAPHIGFAWQLPWLGRGLTTLRGGWSVSYAPVDNFNQYAVYIADVSGAGTSRVEAFTGRGTDLSYSGYMDLTDLNGKVTGSGSGGGILDSSGFLNPSDGKFGSGAKPMQEKLVGRLTAIPQ